jgi:hypothetical protein
MDLKRTIIDIDEKAQDNGLAQMLADLMEQNLAQNSKKLSSFNRLNSAVAISVSDADVDLTMSFQNGHCVIFDGIVGKPALHIRAGAQSIMEMSQMSVRGVWPNLFNPIGREVTKKMFKGTTKVEGLLRHPLSLLRLTSILSVN